MRRSIVTLFAVVAMLIAVAGPVAADTTPSGPFRESGTSKYLSSYSSDCTPQGSRTTCTDTGLDAFSISPDEIVVCVYVYSYTYSDRTGRGRFIGSEDGCSDPIASSGLVITVSRNQMEASLASTTVTLNRCNRRACTESRTVTVSASDSGSPVATFTNRGSFKDGTCTFRYSESGYSAEVAGTITIDGVTIPETGYAQVSDYKVQSSCR